MTMQPLTLTAQPDDTMVVLTVQDEENDFDIRMTPTEAIVAAQDLLAAAQEVRKTTRGLVPAEA